ncbi:MAG TPA: aminotransferase class V-fold PLP-dependent enzyme [Vicinamibacterales bacterium]|nr:aminotransferase class V-fold PLP-dependent enzyme [Vicinamibacterales bacterium]
MPTWTRRSFLLTGVAAASAAVAGRSAEAVAGDEAYWREIQQAFDVDRTLINLNSGNSSPSPRVVHDTFKRALDSSNRLPAYYRDALARNMEAVRRELADEFGCDADELAITRNATESMHIVQCGLDLKPGDEVLTTDQDYSLMLWAWNQRALRDGLTVTRIQFPVPAAAEDLAGRFERAITPRTKVLHFCHMTNTTGQIFPVRDLSRLARKRGILSVVDGAQAVAHVPLHLHDLECDVYGTSLHKWLMAPHDTGFLYVRRERIAEIWPLHAERDIPNAHIQKFEEVGTHAAAPAAAIPAALAFYRAIGAERKAARLRLLSRRWIDALAGHPRVRVLTSLDPSQLFGMATIEIDGVNAQRLAQYLLDAHRIVVAAEVDQKRPGPVFEHQGLRVTPNVYTTLDEIDRFTEVMRGVLKNGVPAA